MSDLYETPPQGNQSHSLDKRLTRGPKGLKPKRPRGVTKIITETEARWPPQPRGQNEHLWSPPREQPPLLWRLPKVLAIVAVGKTQLLDAVARGIFPKPIKVLEGGRAVAWVAQEVIRYLEGRIAKRDRDGVDTSA